MRKLLLLFIPLLFAHIAVAQDNSVVLGAELRPRFILNDGYKKLLSEDEKPFGYVTQRTRLFSTFQRDNLSANVAFQDVRAWGNDNLYTSSGVFGNTNSVSLFTGWFKYKFTESLYLKTGRQLLSYDDQRIISARAWNDYQVTYDAVLFNWSTAMNKLDLAVSWNVNSTANADINPAKFKLFSFLRYERQMGDFNVSAISVITANTLTDTTTDLFYRGTYGAYLRYSSGNNKAVLSGYFQNNLNDNGKETSAFCLSLLLNRKLPGLNSDVSAGIDWLSGQDATKTGSYQNTNHRFDILYGKRHGAYGYMDYFSTTPQQGLVDYFIKYYYSFGKGLQLGADYHYFTLAGNLYQTGTTTKASKDLGQEFDFTFKANIVKDVKLQAGYSFYLATDTFKQIKAVENVKTRFPQFFYLMITVNLILRLIYNKRLSDELVIH